MSHDDFTFEPVRGLPEALPEGEHILWQGSPSTMRLAREGLKMNWIIGYFAVLAVWRVGVSSTMLPLNEAALHAVPFAVICALVCLMLMGIAWVQAKRDGLYADQQACCDAHWCGADHDAEPALSCRSAMRSLDLKPSGHGTIAFELLDDTRFSYLTLWPTCAPGISPRRNLRCAASLMPRRSPRSLPKRRRSEPASHRSNASPLSALAAE